MTITPPRRLLEHTRNTVKIMSEPRAIPVEQQKFALERAQSCCVDTLGMYLHGAAAVEVGSVVQCRRQRADPAHRVKLDDAGFWRPTD